MLAAVGAAAGFAIHKATGGSAAEVIDRAEASFVPVKPNMWLNVSLGVVVGLFLGVGLTFFLMSGDGPLAPAAPKDGKDKPTADLACGPAGLAVACRGSF